jgi:hypothetical protein
MDNGRLALISLRKSLSKLVSVLKTMIRRYQILAEKVNPPFYATGG